jgi:hypothetical protein
MGVSDVSTHDFEVVVCRHFFQPAPVIEGVVKTECPDLAAFGKKGFR